MRSFVAKKKEGMGNDGELQALPLTVTNDRLYSLLFLETNCKGQKYAVFLGAFFEESCFAI